MRRVWCAGVAVLAAMAVQSGLASSADAGTIPYPKTDVMFVFDTTGSMADAIEEAKAEIREAMEQISDHLPDVQFALSQVRDYGGSVYDEENPDDVPWELRVTMTPDREVIAAGIELLEAEGGGDSPEAYSRALWEADTNPGVGWRPDARHLIVVIADEVPHDNDLDEGIPSTEWYEPAPWDTGQELVTPAGVIGTQLTSSTNLDLQAVLQKLAADGKPLEFVDYQGEPELLPYWLNWAERTGGVAAYADAGELVSQLVGVTAAGGTAAACATVHGSIGKVLLGALKCDAVYTWLGAKCGFEIVVGKAIKALAVGKGLIRISKVKKKWRSAARLINAIKSARFGKHAPKGFRSPGEALHTLEHAKNAFDFIRDLRGLAKAVSPADYRRIARLVADLAGVRSCADGLIAAVSG